MTKQSYEAGAGIEEFKATLFRLNKEIGDCQTSPGIPPLFNLNKIETYLNEVSSFCLTKNGNDVELLKADIEVLDTEEPLSKLSVEAFVELINTLKPLVGKYDADSALVYVLHIEHLRDNLAFLNALVKCAAEDKALKIVAEEARCYESSGCLKDVLDQFCQEPVSSIITKRTLALMAIIGPNFNDDEDQQLIDYLISIAEHVGIIKQAFASL